MKLEIVGGADFELRECVCVCVCVFACVQTTKPVDVVLGQQAQQHFQTCPNSAQGQSAPAENYEKAECACPRYVLTEILHHVFPAHPNVWSIANRQKAMRTQSQTGSMGYSL